MLPAKLAGRATRVAPPGDPGQRVPFEIVPEIDFAHHGLRASKLGKKASTNLGAIHFAYSGNAVARVLACEKGIQIVERPEPHRIARLRCRAADMGEQEDILQACISVMDSRLAVEDIKAGGENAPALERIDQRIVVDDSTAIASAGSNSSRSRFSNPRVVSVAGQWIDNTSQTDRNSSTSP